MHTDDVKVNTLSIVCLSVAPMRSCVARASGQHGGSDSSHRKNYTPSLT